MAARLVVLLSECFPTKRPFGRQTLWLFEAAHLYSCDFVVMELSSVWKAYHAQESGLLCADGWCWDGDAWRRGVFEVGGIFDRCSGMSPALSRMWKVLSRALPLRGVWWSNPASFIQLSSDKWATYLACQREKSPCVESMLYGGESSAEWLRALRWEEGVCKPRYGSHGEGLWRWSSAGVFEQEGVCRVWEDWCEKRAGESWIFQPFVSCVEEVVELRCWLQRSEEGRWMIVGAAGRVGAGGWIRNLARGGHYHLLRGAPWGGLVGALERRFYRAVGDEALGALSCCQQVMSALEDTLCENERMFVCECALDLIRTEEGWRLLECNSKPGRQVSSVGEEEARSARRALVMGPFLYLSKRAGGEYDKHNFP